MNVKLLRRIQKQILKEPKQFFMESYFTKKEDDDYKLKLPKKIPNCGTAACIGGWAVVLSLKKMPSVLARKMSFDIVFETARMVLRLDTDLAESLFSCSNWPQSFYDAYFDATIKHQWARRAKVAAKRIDYFIEHGE